MKITNEFLIPFVGLKLGKHQFEYQINNTFFERFEYQDYESSDIKAKVILEKKQTLLELSFSHTGTVNVPCDLTNEYFDLPVKSKLKIIVQFGEVYNNDNEELLILPHGEFQVDVSQYIYEMIVLSVPVKRVHPDAKNGKLQIEGANLVSEIKEQKQVAEEKIDPRWDKLKQLLTDK